ncbi:MAG TPA: hypothetical protein VMW16_06285 [Sedimentisphaerales bacterium]|nr:hypothetical protein [Sedimentisphaerales bacterium]
MISVKTERSNRVSQGDIYKDVEWIEHTTEHDGALEISKIKFPLVIVLTQDCDLAQDSKFRWEEPQKDNHDKFVLSVLVAPIYNAEHVFQGTHLSELNLTMGQINKGKTQGNYLITNQNPRYHYLEFPEELSLVPSVIDFKHYFSVDVESLRKLKEQNFVCAVSELFREDISQRFASFLSRIGLPEIKRL